MNGTLAGAPPFLAGLGAVTGYGWGTEALGRGLGSGHSAARRQEIDGVCTTAAVVPAPGAEVDPVAEPDDGRYEHMVRWAVREAVADAGLHGWRAGRTVGVVFCTGIGDIRSVRDGYFRGGAPPRPSRFPRLLHTSVASLLSQEHGWTGPNVVLNAACSSGNAALQMADLWLRAGLATDVVVAGAELCVIGEIVTGFRRMRVHLGERAAPTDCRPFQEGSRGFFLGEAAVAVVVSARADGGRARYLGGATTHDAFHPVASEPGGRELERGIVEALERARTPVADVALVKAHGSGTPANDAVEAAVVDRLFPPTTRLSSFKPLLGHCMGVSALAELAAVLVAHRVGRLPGPVTSDPAHPRLTAGGPPTPGPVVCASVGLGGTNAVAVLDITPGGPHAHRHP